MNPVTGKLERTPEGKWKLPARCNECGVTLTFITDEKPGPIAVKAGNLFVCERCAMEADAAEERAELERDRGKRIEKSGLPRDLRGLTFQEMIAHDDRSNAIEAARSWAENEGAGGLLLHGPVGVGKTRLAATATWRRLENWPVKWISVAVLIAELGAAFNDSARRNAIAAITGEHPLVLDDFDKVNPSEWARSQLFAAVDRRAQAGTPMLVTTNLAPAKLRDKFGDAIASRLAGLRVVKLQGPDYRLKLDETL